MEFQEFPKIPRLNREVIVTEKIDGTNASVCIQPASAEPEVAIMRIRVAMVEHEGALYDVFAGSRNRWITPENDNFGFASWVAQHSTELMKLGVGHHYGEWWGAGIQRRYGLTEKRFSLFNTSRWNDETKPACCHVVPVLRRLYSPAQVNEVLDQLEIEGSAAAPGFMQPEGVIAYHVAANMYFKATVERDEEPKSKAKAA